MRGLIRHPERLSPTLTYELLGGVGKPGVIPALAALLAYDFRERLSQIEAPTLVVWGKHDLIVPARDADEFVRLIPKARKVIFDDCGHVPMVEQPERFNREVREFLAA